MWLLFSAALLFTTFTMVVWTALALAKGKDSKNDERMYLGFAAFLLVLPITIFALRHRIKPDYFSGLLLAVFFFFSWVGWLLLCACGIVWGVAAYRRQEPYARFLIVACLSGIMFITSCIMLKR